MHRLPSRGNMKDEYTGGSVILMMSLSKPQLPSRAVLTSQPDNFCSPVQTFASIRHRHCSQLPPTLTPFAASALVAKLDASSVAKPADSK